MKHRVGKKAKLTCIIDVEGKEYGLSVHLGEDDESVWPDEYKLNKFFETLKRSVEEYADGRLEMG